MRHAEAREDHRKQVGGNDGQYPDSADRDNDAKHRSAGECTTAYQTAPDAKAFHHIDGGHRKVDGHEEETAEYPGDDPKQPHGPLHNKTPHDPCPPLAYH